MPTKKCKNCEKILPLDNFYNKPGRPNGYSYCKKCSLFQTLKRQRAIKQKAIEYKGGSCQVCGLVDAPCVYDFHHIDPSKKDFSISHYKAYSFNLIKDELDKCILLCSNCHRKEHWNKDNVVWNLKTPDKKIFFCIECNKKVTGKHTKRCMACVKYITKISWPDKDSLSDLIKIHSMVAIGKMLGVSDNAVRKRAKKYGIL